MQKHWEELKRRKAITIETVNRRASGEIVPVEVTTNYVVFEGEEYVAGTIRDISERKRAEGALRASEERFRTLVDHATDAFGLVDDRGIIIDVNREACESRGYRREEMIGMSVSEVDPDVDLDVIQKRFEAGEEVLTFESRNRRKDGTVFPVEVRTRRFVSQEGRLFSLTLGRDITERKRAEEALRKSEELYRALLEVSPQMIWGMRGDTSDHYFNQWWYDSRLTRRERRPRLQVVHPAPPHRGLVAAGHRAGREWVPDPVRRAADGQFRWHFSRGLPVRDADGRIVRWVGVAIDIHDRREAEEALRRSEAWLSEAQRLSHTGSWVLDWKTNELKHWSPELLRICGFDPDAGIPSTEAVRERTHPEDRAKNLEEVETAIRERTGVAGERRVVLPDGTIRHLDVIPTRSVGQPIEIIRTAMDVTERKCAEEALRESEERYRALIEVSPQMVWMARADGSNIFWNQWWYDYTGLTRAESEDFGWVQAVHPEHRDRHVDLWQQALASGVEWNNEAPLRRADGQYRWLLGGGGPVGDAEGRVVRWMGIGIDIHARGESEDALRRSEAWLSEAQRLSRTGSFAASFDTRELIYVSPELLRIYGFDPADGTPSTEAVLRRFHPEDRLGVVEAFERVAREKTGHGAEWRLVLPDGTMRYIQSHVDPVFNAVGRPVELIGTTMDVTERKLADQALRESEERYRRSEAYLAEAQKLTHTGNWAMNLETRQVVYWSQELFRLFGFDPEEGIPSTESMLRRIHPDDRAQVLETLRRAVREKTDYDFDCRVVRPDGTTRHLHTAFWPTVNAASGPEDMIGTVMDTTARKHADEAPHQAAALAHMTRVTTLGELTASIAHEVNQPLAAIVNNAGACLALLSRKRADVEELRAALADITGDAERASAVIERVRGLAKRSAPERTPVRLTDLVHEVVALMRAEAATRRVAIRTDIPADLPLVLGDRVQLQQVLLNLVVNAMDAMSGADERDRSLDIRGRVDMDDGCPAVTIGVEDRGVGLQPDELERLFEAFYTTKPHGMGSAWRSAARSSRPTAAGCGANPTAGGVRCSPSVFLRRRPLERHDGGGTDRFRRRR